MSEQSVAEMPGPQHGPTNWSSVSPLHKDMAPLEVSQHPMRGPQSVLQTLRCLSRALTHHQPPLLIGSLWPVSLSADQHPAIISYNSRLPFWLSARRDLPSSSSRALASSLAPLTSAALHLDAETT